MEILSHLGSLDCLNSMYPSKLISVNEGTISLEEFKYSTVYGYSLGDGCIKVNKNYYSLSKDSFFSIPVFDDKSQRTIEFNGQIVLFVRSGFLGQTIYSAQAEEQGRLSYIDGCSDSILVSPPRYGDPSLNLLFFPKKIQQSFHTHPSIRFGLVASGEGVAETKEGIFKLSVGNTFLIHAHEYHRFYTDDSTLRIIAYHPEGDFGPTDQNHSMINRTYCLNI